jgi:hypothetical protein
MHFIVALINCRRRSSRDAVRRLLASFTDDCGIGLSAAGSLGNRFEQLSVCHKLNE